uniref:Uncharacterized protein n=1 Tax=Glossina palpalis gambiensis TaxID=67801 RepID=A0A1B0AKL1_9MUSC
MPSAKFKFDNLQTKVMHILQYGARSIDLPHSDGLASLPNTRHDSALQPKLNNDQDYQTQLPISQREKEYLVINILLFLIKNGYRCKRCYTLHRAISVMTIAMVLKEPVNMFRYVYEYKREVLI